MAVASPAEFLRAMFDAAVKAADPRHCLPAFLPPAGKGRTIVIGAGKAAAAMALAVEDNWRGGPLSGLVVTRYGHGAPCRQIEVVEAGHPLPDEAGQGAAGRIVDMVSALTSDDLVICLMSGGGSALLSLPAKGLSLGDKQAVNKALLASGASIAEMNVLRKHLSAIKGGCLALAVLPAKLLTLAISDVPGDDPAIIASGPTVPDRSTRQDALDILRRYDIAVPPAVSAHLALPKSETPKPDHPLFANSNDDAPEFHLIATPQQSLMAAAEVARGAGVMPLILGDAIEGEAREVAIVMGGIARQVKRHGQPVKPPAVLLSGGETTVTLRGNSRSGGGRGGRNGEFLLALAIYLNGEAGVHALACDSDGIDGSEDNAGAIVSPDVLSCAAGAGLDARALLGDNDSYSFFDGVDCLVKTGPTLTNVNDFRAIYIDARDKAG